MSTPTQSQLGRHSGDRFPIPPFDYQAFTYVASGVADDDDVATITYKSGGADGRVVAILTFTYVAATNNVASVTLSL